MKKKGLFGLVLSCIYPVFGYNFHKRVLPPCARGMLSVIRQKRACVKTSSTLGLGVILLLFSWGDFLSSFRISVEPN